MLKIMNDKNKVVLQSNDLNCMGIVTELFDNEEMGYRIYESLSELIQTMTGDSITPFNTIREMISLIPEIMDCEEETNIIDVEGKFIVLGWNHEDNVDIWTKIINSVYEGYTVIEIAENDSIRLWR